VKDVMFLTGKTPLKANVSLAALLVSIKNSLGENHEFWKRIASANSWQWTRYTAAFDAQDPVLTASTIP
jgi:hypothetical protein